jgi:hypothetical protein
MKGAKSFSRRGRRDNHLYKKEDVVLAIHGHICAWIFFLFSLSDARASKITPKLG